jgi:hypothetical protein
LKSLGFLIPAQSSSIEVKTVRNLVEEFNAQHLMRERRKRRESQVDEGPEEPGAMTSLAHDHKKTVQVFDPIVATVSFNDSFLTTKAGKHFEKISKSNSSRNFQS